jgi:hypothetical protein
MPTSAFISIGGMILLLCAACALPGMSQIEMPEEKVSDILARPFITGASVSANYGTQSPSLRASLRYTEPHQVAIVAFGGTPGAETIHRVDKAALADRSVILAMDFLFWDSTARDPTPGLQALMQLMEWAQELDVPLIIGDIPALLPGRQPSRGILNQAIHKQCNALYGCSVLELDAIHRQVIAVGYLEYRLNRYSLPELVPDGLHLSKPAGEYLADRIIELLVSL